MAAPAPPRAAAQAPPRPAPAGAYSPGDWIGDNYRVVKLLGEGGFGLVYLVYSSSAQQLFALKAIRPELAQDPALRAMFEKEAQIWIDLERHPYLVRAYFVNEIHGGLYLAMEYVPPGEDGLNSLEAVLARRPPALAQTLRWSIQFCHGMEYAYSRGVRCHRDIKPANVLIGQDRAVRISDFGIAGVLSALRPAVPGGSGDGTRTEAGAAFGTPTHMPPEQFVDAAGCDERSDVYSFGITLFQMASGRLPFLPPPIPPGPNRSALAFRAFQEMHARAPVPPLDSPLAGVIRHCLEKDRARRWTSFKQLRAELEAMLRTASGEVVKPPPATELDAWELSNKGISLASLGRHQEALDCYDRALAKAPDLAALHNNRGNALNQLGRGEEALAAFERAIQLEPGYAMPWVNKGLSLARLGRPLEALPAFEQALRLDPTSADAYLGRGVVLGELGRSEEQLDAYDRALEIDPRHPLAWMNKAGALLEAGKGDGALDCFDRALNLDPRNADAWVGRATCLGELRRMPEALEAFDQAVALAPEDPRAWYNRGNVLVALERLADGLASFRRATELAPETALPWYNRGLAELRLGESGEAQRSLERFLALAASDDPLRPSAQTVLTKLRTGEEIHIGGVGELRRDGAGPRSGAVHRVTGEVPPPPPPPVAAPKSLPPGITATTADAWNRAGAELFQHGRFAEALACCDQALTLNRHHAQAWSNRANALFRLDRRDEAIAGQERALRCDPALIEAWFSKAAIEFLSGRKSDALASYREFLALATPAHAALMQEAHANVAQLEAAGVQPAARSDAGWLSQGLRAGMDGRLDEALTAFDRAIALAPDMAEGWQLRGDVLFDLGRIQESIAAYDEALQRDSSDARTWHGKATDLGRLGQWSQAVTCFDQAVRLDPTRAGAWSDRGKALGAIGRHEEAIESLETALRFAPNHPSPWLNKALSEDALKRTAAAAASYGEFIKRARPGMEKQVQHARERLAALSASPAPSSSPNAGPPAGSGGVDMEACLRQGAMSLNQRQFERARGLFLAACGADPGSAAAWEGHGDSLVGLSRFAEAADCYSRALGVQPSPGLWRKRAGALQALGHLDEALEACEKALGLQQREPGLWDLKGALLLKLGRPQEALAALAMALARDARHPLARFHKAEAEDALGQAQAAAVSFKQFLALAPPHLATQIEQARARLQELRAK